MNIILVLCLLIAIPLLLFVLAPFLSFNNNKLLSNSIDGFSDENELRTVTVLRDHLFQKLIFGKSSNIKTNEISEEEAFKSLVVLCGRLQKAGLNWEPEKIEKPFTDENSENGFSKFEVLFIIFFSLSLIITIFYSSSSTANESSVNNLQNEKVTIPSNVTIPAPTISSNLGSWIPSVNQYILIPMQGYLHVYYVGMFSNIPNIKEANIQIPLPYGFKDLKIIGNPDLTIEKTSTEGTPIIRTPLTEQITQLRAEFLLPAFNGVVQWRPSDLLFLPGVTIIIMPEYNAGLRNFLSKFSNSVNIWPPRILNAPSDFQSSVGEDLFDNEVSLPKKNAKQMSRLLVRQGNSDTAFPSFDINGILPSRMPIYVMTLFLVFFLFGVAMFFIFKASK